MWLEGHEGSGQRPCQCDPEWGIFSGAGQGLTVFEGIS